MITFWRHLAFLLVGCGLLAQSPVESWISEGRERIYKYLQKRADNSQRTFYSNWDGKDKTKRPAILYFQGSGRDSILHRCGMKLENVSMEGATELLDVAGNRYWVFAFEKRGIHPFDTEETGKASAEVNRYNTWEYRTQEAVEVLKSLKKHPAVDSRKIVVFGFSEGTDVVMGALTRSKIPTHALYFSGGGATQMFDLAVLARNVYSKNIFDVVEREKKVEEFLGEFQKILQDPTSEKEFLGLPYRRWASFFKKEPDKLFLKVKIPVFLAHGTADESVPIESIDYLQTQMILHGKTNITFQRYPGLTHRLQLKGDEDSEASYRRKMQVYRDALIWLADH